MNKIILALSVMICGCSHQAENRNPYTYQNNIKGIDLSNARYTYDSWHGLFKVSITVHNTGVKHIQNYDICADYYKNGGKVGGENGAAPDDIKKGETTTMTFDGIFPTKNDLPDSIVFSTKTQY